MQSMFRYPQNYCFEIHCSKSNAHHCFSFTLEYSHGACHRFVSCPNHSRLQKHQCPVSGAHSPAPLAQAWFLQKVPFPSPRLWVRVRQQQAVGLTLCYHGPGAQPDLIAGFRLLCRNTSFLFTTYYTLQSFLLHACD